MSSNPLQGVRGFVSIGEALNLYFDRLDFLQQHEGKVFGVPTGFRDFDELFGGFEEGELIVLAAHTEVGASTLAVQFAHACAQDDRVGIVFTSKYTVESVLQRLLSIETGIPNSRLHQGQIDAEEWDIVSCALGRLSALDLYICVTLSLSIADLRSKVLDFQGHHKLDFIQVDYFQLMTIHHSGDDRFPIGLELSRQLKILARELRVPILLVVELSSFTARRSSYIPTLGDLRAAGLPDDHCDKVLFVYREELYDPETEKKGLAELHIAKHRNGPLGIVNLRFIEETEHFTDLELYAESEY